VFASPQPATRAELEALADPSPVVVGALASRVTRQAYDRAFDAVRSALEAGLTYQVNLTFPVEGSVVSGPAWSWRSALRLWLDLVAAQGREGSFAALGTPSSPGPLLASASPELFFHREGTTVEARPMKGTAPRDPDPARDAAHRHELSVSPKDRAENLMVTDMLRNDLGRLAVAAGVSVPRLFDIEEYPTVWQMTSTVRAQIPVEVSLTELMAALFPCASITGAPKESTQGVIAAVEAGPRGWYTGTLGWHRSASWQTGPARSRFSVLIRTLVFEDGPGFRLGVGGGVVWDSTAQGEWDEAWAKTRFLAPARRRFGLTEAVLWEPEAGLFLLAEHEARLATACAAFGGRLEPGVLGTALEAEVGRLRAAGQGGPFKLRAVVDPEFRLSVEGEAVSPLPEVLTAALAPRPFGPDSLLVRRFKTTDRRVYDGNRAPGVDQTLHYNERGELTESTSMTLVLETGRRFLTPALACGLLDGTFRARLLAEGKLEEAVLPVAALASADRVWLVNSVRRWKAVRLVEA
jgi:para-aminobenzoate synthetase/4-amino-4-deoxychorismate lyase